MSNHVPPCDNFVTVRTFATPEMADQARNRLAAEGIRAYLADEMTVSTPRQPGNAPGGVKVQVAEEDAEKAAAVLEDEDDEDAPMALESFTNWAKPLLWLIFVPLFAGIGLALLGAIVALLNALLS